MPLRPAEVGVLTQWVIVVEQAYLIKDVADRLEDHPEEDCFDRLDEITTMEDLVAILGPVAEQEKRNTTSTGSPQRTYVKNTRKSAS